MRVLIDLGTHWNSCSPGLTRRARRGISSGGGSRGGGGGGKCSKRRERRWWRSTGVVEGCRGKTCEGKGLAGGRGRGGGRAQSLETGSREGKGVLDEGVGWRGRGGAVREGDECDRGAVEVR